MELLIVNHFSLTGSRRFKDSARSFVFQADKMIGFIRKFCIPDQLTDALKSTAFKNDTKAGWIRPCLGAQISGILLRNALRIISTFFCCGVLNCFLPEKYLTLSLIIYADDSKDKQLELLAFVVHRLPRFLWINAGISAQSPCKSVDLIWVDIITPSFRSTWPNCTWFGLKSIDRRPDLVTDIFY